MAAAYCGVIRAHGVTDRTVVNFGELILGNAIGKAGIPMNMGIHSNDLWIFVQGITQAVLPPALGPSQLSHFGVMENNENWAIWIRCHQFCQLFIQPIFRLVVAVIGIVFVIHIVGQGDDRNTAYLCQMGTITPVSSWDDAGVASEVLLNQGVNLGIVHIEVVSATVVDIVSTGQGQQNLRFFLHVITNTGQKKLPFVFSDIAGHIFVAVDAIAVKHEGIDGAALLLGIGIGCLEYLGKSVNGFLGRYRTGMDVRYHGKP